MENDISCNYHHISLTQMSLNLKMCKSTFWNSDFQKQAPIYIHWGAVWKYFTKLKELQLCYELHLPKVYFFVFSEMFPNSNLYNNNRMTETATAYHLISTHPCSQLIYQIHAVIKILLTARKLKVLLKKSLKHIQLFNGRCKSQK